MRKRKKMVNYHNSNNDLLIYHMTATTDNISKVELIKRDESIQELTTKYNKELNLRKETEQQKEQIELQLVSIVFTYIMTILIIVCIGRHTKNC